ncbi:putative membrane protein [Lachnospiraceae bacterium KM106-2]|nr:putative membrane protein [Lachnospiraceae bacterium KM106-2]
MEIILAVILGGLFGYALYFAGASNPRQLLSMLRLEDLSLMKIIVFAIGFASILLSISIGIGIFDLSHLSIKATNLGVIIGGLIFGLGFGSAGTCPGTCVAATGTDGIKKAIAAVLGGLTGAFAFSMTYGWWKNIGLFDQMNFGKITLFHLSDKFPSVFQFGAIGLFITGVIFVVIACMIPMRGRQ